MVIEDKNDHSETLNLLKEGNLTLKGRLIEASNASLYGTIEFGDQYLNVIYKPIAGERPLWDFSEGNLASREVATYLVSEALNLKCVPPTLLRDGQFGEGSVQLWIDDCEETGDRYLERSQGLRKIAFLDAVVNNTDRKIGHLLFKNEMVYGCDHGVTFHEEYKLRTVLWQFADENLTESEIRALENFNLDLSGYLTESEIAALRDRINELLKTRKFPLPPTDWPAVPWPPV